jgi:alkylation response protein AidB-like acyl-CoA dehydrogenase
LNFGFSEEEQLLADTAREFARKHFGSSAARACLAGGWDPAPTWREMAELGWLGLLVPESHGGAGGSLVDAAILIETLTRALAPVPYSGHAVLGATALRLFGTPEQARSGLPELAAGSRFSVALSESLDWPPAGERAIAWQWLPGARVLLAGGERLTVLDAASVRPARSQDLLQGSGLVDGLREAAPRSEAALRFVATARVASAAALVGAMAGALDLAVAHASTREQFGRKIGSFQAVRHLCSEMLVELESSRSALYGAAWAVDHLETGEAARMAAIAKAWCAETARRACESAVQVHGGIGCTWESDVHLYLRVAAVEAASFGGRAAALDALAERAQQSPDGPRG